MTTAADTRAAVDRATEGAPIRRLLDWAGMDSHNIPELAERERWLDANDLGGLLDRMADTARARIAGRVMAGEICLQEQQR